MRKENVIGIVAEYNPFHKGHAYQIETAKAELGATGVIAVMSGNFTQRGEAALLDKWQRAHLALAGGADLVLELPAVYALRSSEVFGAGGVKLLAATGLVSHLVFGCETTQPELLAQMASTKLSKAKLAPYLDKGMTYGAAVEACLTKLYPQAANLLKGPNNILALSYYQTLHKIKSPLVPYPIIRQGAGYKDDKLGSAFPSAQAIRLELKAHGLSKKVAQSLPPKTLTLLPEMVAAEPQHSGDDNFYLLLKHTLSQMSAREIAKHSDCSEGLENKFISALKAAGYEEFLSMVKSKRYPLTRLKRLTCQLLISSVQAPFSTTQKLAPQYLRVLGFNDRGRRLLKTMKDTSHLPILTKLHKNEGATASPAFRAELATDISATNLYDLLKGNGGFNRDYLVSPIYYK
jgi:predicted nucleotidyltransferase